MFPSKHRKDFTTLLNTDVISFMLILLQNFWIVVKWGISEKDKRTTNEGLEDIISIISR